MPQFQVFFAAAPLSVILGLSVFALSPGRAGHGLHRPLPRPGPAVRGGRRRWLTTPDPESKTEEATPRKLEEARKKGDVAKSPDVAPALSLTGRHRRDRDGRRLFRHLDGRAAPALHRRAPHHDRRAGGRGGGRDRRASPCGPSPPSSAPSCWPPSSAASAATSAQSGLMFTRREAEARNGTRSVRWPASSASSAPTA